MPRRVCYICAHPHRDEIESQLYEGRLRLDEILELWVKEDPEITVSKLSHHRQHMPSYLVRSKCAACLSPDRDEIDRARLSGERIKDIAIHFSLPYTTLRYHFSADHHFNKPPVVREVFRRKKARCKKTKAEISREIYQAMPPENRGCPVHCAACSDPCSAGGFWKND